MRSHKRRRKISLEEEQEIERSIQLADLVKPLMVDGLDVSLFTKKERDLMNKLQKEHNQLFRKRAKQLRFYPDTLNRKEESAVLRCMTYDELKPFYRIVAIQEKNRRLQNILVIKKVDIRRYCRMTVQFGESDHASEFDLPDLSIAKNTERYFAIMLELGEVTYEEAYYFLTDEHRTKVAKVYAKSVLEVELADLDQTEIQANGG